MSEEPRSKKIIVLPAAERDILEALDYYRAEGGPALAMKWVAAIHENFMQISAHPYAGSLRYAEVLQLEEVRFRVAAGFPYLIFYRALPDEIQVWRVLHGQRDIPAWLQKFDL